jgi:hypothetical protein
MLAQPVSDFLSSSAALCDAVLRLRGHALTEELGRIVRAVMNSPLGEYVPADSASMLLPPPVDAAVAANDDGAVPSLSQDIRFDDHYFGRFVVSGRAHYSELDRQHLASLASLLGSVLQVHSVAQRTTHAYVQVEAKLQHQAQILDQIHESVLTMDMTASSSAGTRAPSACSATPRWKRWGATSCSSTMTKTSASTTPSWSRAGA